MRLALESRVVLNDVDQEPDFVEAEITALVFAVVSERWSCSVETKVVARDG